MIGQEALQLSIKEQISKDIFPRFTIFVGDRGSGKKTLIKECVIPLSEQRGMTAYEVPDIKIDTLRQFIGEAYKKRNMVFIIYDADNMSVPAKNSILKVVEECPNNNYFIMTLEGENNTLDTIKSRATLFYMDRYTPDEIYQYVKEVTNYTIHDDEWSIIKDICETPGDVNVLSKYPREFYDYVELVVDNIAEVSGANAFKVANQVALKEDSDGYDLRLFWKAFIKVLVNRSISTKDTGIIYDCCQGVKITSEHLRELRIRSANKQMVMDSWILDIRKAWV